MSDNAYGCGCCGGAIGGLFRFDTDRFENATAITRRSFLGGASAIAGLAAHFPVPALADDGPSTVFSGGTILTVDRSFSEAEAIAIRGNKIVAVGSLAAVRAEAGAAAVHVDLGGKAMLPGFIDPHTHVVAGAMVDAVAENVGMTRFATAAEVLAHLRTAAGATPPGQWILGRNFDPSVQEGPEALTFAELDAVSNDHPVFVLNASLHLAYANSKAFQVAGIAEDIADPPGAEFVRDAAGKLTGVMKNNVAFMMVLGKSPAMESVEPVEALISLLNRWRGFGLTTVSELSLGALTQSPADHAIMKAAAATGRLSARIRAYPFYTVGSAAWDAAGIAPGSDDPWVRVAGYKLVADGSNQGFTGLQREPYLNSESRGVAYMSAEELKAVALERVARNWPLAIHGNGDAAIDNVLDACQAVRDAGFDMAKVRARIEHCSMLHDDQIARMKELGVSASFLIGHVYYWGVWMRDRVFGPERVQHLVRCRSVENEGIGFTLHSDFAVTDPNPLHMIQMAVTRATWKESGHVLNPAERVSVESAIRALTSEAAWQLFSEHEVGSIEPGKLADLVILDRDPRRTDPSAIKDIKVLETWIDGKRIFTA